MATKILDGRHCCVGDMDGLTVGDVDGAAVGLVVGELVGLGVVGEPVGLADGEVDGAVAAMVLHHLETLEGALGEMRRVIRPGGSAVVLELAPHREAWMRAELGDHHLGLDTGDVTAAFARAGFEDVRLEPVDDHYCPQPPDAEAGPGVSLSLFIVRGRVPRATA